MVALGEKRRMKDWLREKNLGEEEKQQPGAPTDAGDALFLNLNDEYVSAHSVFLQLTYILYARNVS